MDEIDAFEKELMAMVSPDNDKPAVPSTSGPGSGDSAPDGGDLLDFLGSNTPTTHSAMQSDDDLLDFLDFTGANPQDSAKKEPVLASPVPVTAVAAVVDEEVGFEVTSKVSAEVTDELQKGVILDALNELEGETKGSEELESSLLDGEGEGDAATEPRTEEGEVESDARIDGDFTTWHRESESPSQTDATHLHPCSYAAINKHFFGAYGKSVGGVSTASMSSQHHGDRVEAWSPDHYYITSVVEVVVRPDVTLENIISVATAVGKHLRLPMARPQVDQLLLLGNRRRIDDEREEARALKAATAKEEAEKMDREKDRDVPAPSIRDIPPENESPSPRPAAGERTEESGGAAEAVVAASAPAPEAQTGLFSSSVIAGTNLNEGLSSLAAGMRTWGGSLFSPGADSAGSTAGSSGGKGDGQDGDAAAKGDSASRSTSMDQAGASFLGINISSVASALLGLEDEQNSIYSAKNRREWNPDYDLLDLRVCVSKELNQRTLVAQFLKRADTPEAVAAADAADMPSAPASSAGLPPSADSTDLMKSKPHVLRFVAGLKAALQESRLLLSSLYAERVEQVCALQDSRAFGLCDHYYLQLSAMYHASTLLRLKQPLVAMSEWALKAERATACFVTMLKVMVEKEHVLAMPVYLPPLASAGDASGSLGAVPEPDPEKGEGKAADKSNGKEKGKGSEQEEEEEEEEEEQGSITLVQLFDKRAREAASSKGGAQRRVGSISTSQAILQQPHYSSEGLAKCLLAINSLTDSVIRHCDKVSTRHVDDKNAEIVRLLGALTSYKLSIVQTMVDNAETSQTSAVGLTFLRLFKDAKVSLPLPPSASPVPSEGQVAFTKYAGGSVEKPAVPAPAPARAEAADASTTAATASSGGGLLDWASSVLSPVTTSSADVLSPAPSGTGNGGGSPEPSKEMKVTKAALMANRLKELRGLRKDAESASRAGKDKDKDKSPARPAASTVGAASIPEGEKEKEQEGGPGEGREVGVVAMAAGLDFRWTEAVVLYYCNVLVDPVDLSSPGTVKTPPSTTATLYITQQHLCLYLGIPALAVGLQGLSSLTASISTLTPTKTALLAGEDAATPATAFADVSATATPPPVPSPAGTSTGTGTAEAGEGARLVFPLNKLHKSAVQRTSNVLGVETTYLQVGFYDGNRAVAIRPLVEETERLRLLLSELTEISTNMGTASE